MTFLKPMLTCRFVQRAYFNDPVSTLVHKEDSENIDAPINVFNAVYVLEHGSPLSSIGGTGHQRSVV